MLKIFEKKEKSKLPEPFENENYQGLEINYDNFFDAKYKPDESLPAIKKIRRISFELSNICNYSYLHKKCPTSCMKTKIILPSEVVYKTIDELAEIGFDGVIAFHRYNEPLIDPRLFMFIEYVNKKLPEAKILILTNGFYLTQDMLNALEKYKLWCIVVSSYSLKEHERISNLNTTIPLRVFFSVLDDRQFIYDDKEKECSAPCLAPLNDFTINCEGEVNLCCLDFDNRFNFGNLKEKTLKEIVESEKFLDCYNNLQAGKRTLEICKRCNWVR